MRDPAGGSPEYGLAIHLGNDRAQLWSKNLATVLQSWTGIGISQDKTGIWKLKKHLPPNLFEFSRWNDWVIIDCGQDKLSLRQGFIEEFERPVFASPLANWLDADLNWPHLGQLFPALSKFDFPKIQMQVVGHGGDLHLDGKIISPQPFALTLDKWRLPTNTIHQPFISFTAARGIAPWLEKQGWALPYEISPVPNQIFIWALWGIPFQTFAAVPVPDANAALDQLHDKFAANPLGPQSQFFMPVQMSMTNHEISWTGVPFAAPFVRALRSPAGDFLFSGLFPNLPNLKPLPPELFTALAPANLVYYQWEVTAERLKLLLQPFQLVFVLSRHKQFDSESVAAKWLNRAGPTLGNTATEITQTAPNELTFTRSAPGGLTAVELFALANWLEAPNFPGCDMSLPPARIKPHMRPMKLLSAPVQRPRRTESCLNSASTLTTSPRCARRGIAGAISANPVPSKRRGCARRRARTASPRTCAKTGGMFKTAMSGSCAKTATRLNLEMANLPEIIAIALKLRTAIVCIVPERRLEVTTEGGLDVVGAEKSLIETRMIMNDAGIEVSLFVAPDEKQIAAAARTGSQFIELHTGQFAESFGDGRKRKVELERLISGAQQAHGFGLKVNAGHGLNYENLPTICRVPHLVELNIGHSIVSRAVLVGLKTAVKEMLRLMAAYH